MPSTYGPADPKNWNKKSVVFIHGIGSHDPGYSEPLYKILHDLDPALVEATRWYEFEYDNVNTALEQKVIQFQKALPAAGQDPSLWQTIADMLIDLGAYLFTIDFHNWIENLFRKKLGQVVADGIQAGVDQFDHDIYLISHSLGTVVSYEMLHWIIDDAQDLGWTSGFKNIRLFTLGSPLAFIRHHKSLFPNPKNYFTLLSQPIGRPLIEVDPWGKVSNIQNWFNIRHQFDPVGSLIPLDKINSNNAVDEDREFNQLKTGVNPHDFGNYLLVEGPFILDKIR